MLSSGSGYMQNGFVIPPRKKRHKIQTSRISLLSYCELKSFLKKHHTSPRFAVTQHDNDKVTYVKAYQIYSLLRHANEVNLRLISDMISLLYSKNVITKSDEIKLIKHSERGLK